MFCWSFTSLVHFWPPQFLILTTSMCKSAIGRRVPPTGTLRWSDTVTSAVKNAFSVKYDFTTHITE